MSVFDTHIHILDKPYSALFNNSRIKDGEDEELALYEEYREAFDIGGAFIICYDPGTCPSNTSNVGSVRRDWMYTFGYVDTNPATMLDTAIRHDRNGHFGLTWCIEPSESADGITDAGT